MNKKNISIEIAFATPERQKIITLTMPVGTILIEAVRQSGIVDLFPDLDLDHAEFGIWSKTKPKTEKLQNGQRIEIYRPLIVDPKESRRKRAEKNALK